MDKDINEFKESLANAINLSIKKLPPDVIVLVLDGMIKEIQCIKYKSIIHELQDEVANSTKEE